MNDTTFELWLEFEYSSPWPTPEDDFFNMTILLGDGRKYALNVWTFRFLERARQYDRNTGDNLGGKYTLPPDLFIERLDRKLIEEVVFDLIHSDQLQEAWLVTE